MADEITDDDLHDLEARARTRLPVSCGKMLRLVAAYRESQGEVERQRNMGKHLCSALDHCLRFSTLKRNYREQYESFADLVGDARKVTGMVK
jgi:hypothetical protein